MKRSLRRRIIGAGCGRFLARDIATALDCPYVDFGFLGRIDSGKRRISPSNHFPDPIPPIATRNQAIIFQCQGDAGVNTQGGATGLGRRSGMASGTFAASTIDIAGIMQHDRAARRPTRPCPHGIETLNGHIFLGGIQH